MNESELYIVGGGGHGRVVLHTVRSAGGEVVGFVDDDPVKQGALIDGVAVIGGLDCLLDGRVASAIVAIGNSTTRRAVAERLAGSGVGLANAIHASAVIMPRVIIGCNNLVAAGTVLVTGVRVGSNVVINTGCRIDHDSLIEDDCYLSPGVTSAGCVTVERGAFVGLGAVLAPNVRIGAGAIVGAGAVVLDDIPSNAKAWGSPARIISPQDCSRDWTRLLAGRVNGNHRP